MEGFIPISLPLRLARKAPEWHYEFDETTIVSCPDVPVRRLSLKSLHVESRRNSTGSEASSPEVPSRCSPLKSAQHVESRRGLAEPETSYPVIPSRRSSIKSVQVESSQSWKEPEASSPTTHNKSSLESVQVKSRLPSDESEPFLSLPAEGELVPAPLRIIKKTPVHNYESGAGFNNPYTEVDFLISEIDQCITEWGGTPFSSSTSDDSTSAGIVQVQSHESNKNSNTRVPHKIHRKRSSTESLIEDLNRTLTKPEPTALSLNTANDLMPEPLRILKRLRAHNRRPIQITTLHCPRYPCPELADTETSDGRDSSDESELSPDFLNIPSPTMSLEQLVVPKKRQVERESLHEASNLGVRDANKVENVDPVCILVLVLICS